MAPAVDGLAKSISRLPPVVADAASIQGPVVADAASIRADASSVSHVFLAQLRFVGRVSLRKRLWFFERQPPYGSLS
jgi:hypothetical protein